MRSIVRVIIRDYFLFCLVDATCGRRLCARVGYARGNAALLLVKRLPVHTRNARWLRYIERAVRKYFIQSWKKVHGYQWAQHWEIKRDFSNAHFARSRFIVSRFNCDLSDDWKQIQTFVNQSMKHLFCWKQARKFCWKSKTARDLMCISEIFHGWNRKI